jgi:hypothetical protein
MYQLSALLKEKVGEVFCRRLVGNNDSQPLYRGSVSFYFREALGVSCQS